MKCEFLWSASHCSLVSVQERLMKQCFAFAHRYLILIAREGEGLRAQLLQDLPQFVSQLEEGLYRSAQSKVCSPAFW
jgi:hypothetical protein